MISKALGGSLTIDRVCLDCDNRLGGFADSGLINLSAVEVVRHDLELAGQNREIPDPRAKILKIPFVNPNDSKHRVREVVDESGRSIFHTLSYVEFEVTYLDEGTLIQPAHVYIDVADESKAKMLAKSALRKKGIKDKNLLEKLAQDFSDGLVLANNSVAMQRTVPQRSGGHELGLLKIIYELAWYWLGDVWLSDPVACVMRDYLCGRSTSTMLNGKVYDDPDVAIVAVGGDARILHVAYIFEFEGNLLVLLRLFNLFTVGYVVSHEASKYQFPVKNALVFNAVQRSYSENTFSGEPGAIVWERD